MHGDVRELDDLLALDEHDALVECSAEPSALAGRRRQHRLRAAQQPAGRLPLPRARAPRRRPGRVPVHQPRVSVRAPSTPPAHVEAPTRYELAPEQALAGHQRRRRRRVLPARGRAHPVRGHQAGRRAAGHRVRGGVRPADGHRPLRRDRRSVADGQGRPGGVQLLAAEPLLRPRPALHRLRRRGQAGARPAARRRPGRPDRDAARSRPTTGPASPSTSAAAAT